MIYICCLYVNALITQVVLLSMFLGVSNYNMRPMDKTYSRILLFLIFITSFCNSQDYKYDDYDDNNYDYNTCPPCTCPPNPPPLPCIPPPIPPPPSMGKMIFFLF